MMSSRKYHDSRNQAHKGTAVIIAQSGIRGLSSKARDISKTKQGEALAFLEKGKAGLQERYENRDIHGAPRSFFSPKESKGVPPIAKALKGYANLSED